jgi:hypothetical protein
MTEFASLIFWQFYGSSRVPYHLRVDTENALRTTHDNWSELPFERDKDLGWRPGTGTNNFDAFGARLSDFKPSSSRVVAYGDSFVFGADVANNETFPHQLSEMIRENVRNLGVNGYGPDQALLRLKRDLEFGNNPNIVILGMPSENVARVVNIVRKLYVPQERAEMLKPRYTRIGAEWKIVNILPEIANNGHYSENAIEIIKTYDRWYDENLKRPLLGFPYSITTFQALNFFCCTHLSKLFNFQGVYTIIPMPEDLLQVSSGRAPYYAAFLDRVRRRFEPELIVVDILSHPFVAERFHVRPFSGHASAYGNRIVAAAIRDRIHEEVSAIRLSSHAEQLARFSSPEE